MSSIMRFDRQKWLWLSWSTQAMMEARPVRWNLCSLFGAQFEARQLPSGSSCGLACNDGGLRTVQLAAKQGELDK